MNDHKKPDYLSLLPPELLDDIFGLTYKYGGCPPTPLSKSLLPFQERLLFRELDVHAYKSLERLCSLGQRRPEALAHAKVLSINIARKTESKDMAKETKDVGIPSNKLVKLLFRNLKQVNNLQIYGSSRVALFVLDPLVAASSFPNLTFLTLASSFRIAPDPFHPALYTSLQYYSELEFVDDLSLRGPLNASEQSVKGLLYSFGPLLTVSLSDTSNSSQIFNLIDGLFDPEELENLAVDVNLPKGLKLRRTIRQILTITGDTKHPTLKLIVLDNVEGMIGTRIEDEEGPYYDVENDMIDVYPDWILPDWTDGFDEEGLVKFIKLAKKEGIEVEGTAVEAIGIEDKFDEEQAILDELGEGFGDFDGCG